MAIRPAKRLTPAQTALISEHPAEWSAKLAEAQLFKLKSIQIPNGGRAVRPEALCRSLIPAFGGQIPVEVWGLLGVLPPKDSETDVVTFVEPIAARLAIATEAYRYTVTHTNAVITSELLTERMNPEDLLAKPAQMPETYAMFDQISRVRDEALLRLNDDRISERLVRIPKLKLGELPQGWQRTCNLVATGELDVWPSINSRIKATAQHPAVEPGTKPSNAEPAARRPGDSIVDLVAQVIDLRAERERIRLASSTEPVSAADAPRCLPEGTNTAIKLEVLGNTMGKRMRGYLDRRPIAAGSRARSVNINPSIEFIVGGALLTAVSQGLAWTVRGIGALTGIDINAAPPEVVRVATNDPMMPYAFVEKGTNIIVHGPYLPVSIATLLDSIALTGTVGAAAAATVGIGVAIKTHTIGPGSGRVRQLHREYVELNAQRSLELTALQQERWRTNRLLTELTQEIGKQCALDHTALETGMLQGSAADRAHARFEVIGAPPKSLTALLRYSQLVTEAEFIRSINGTPDNVFPSSPQIEKMRERYERSVEAPVKQIEAPTPEPRVSRRQPELSIDLGIEGPDAGLTM